MPVPEADVTTLLESWSRGDANALDRLVPVVYDELRRLAASHLRRESNAATLQPTALVHEVYLKLLDQRRVEYRSRAHFYGAAAQIIRRMLVDYARERNAVKRGGGAEAVTLEDSLSLAIPPEVNMMELDAALTALEAFDADKARLVELRYFAGLSIPETSDVLGVSVTTVKREWAIARAWLYDRMKAS